MTLLSPLFLSPCLLLFLFSMCSRNAFLHRDHGCVQIINLDVYKKHHWQLNISLSQDDVPSCLKTPTVVPVPKVCCVQTLRRPTCGTHLHPDWVEKKLVLQRVRDNIPDSLDPHPYAFRTSRSIEDLCHFHCHPLSLHTPWKPSNTVLAMKKRNPLSLNTSLCNWTLDFHSSQNGSDSVQHSRVFYVSAPRRSYVWQPWCCQMINK